jgi:integrase/recombinase XerD
MSKNQNLLSFKPAELYVGKEWYIAYYALNPSTNQLHRKKIKLNRIKLVVERTKFANKIIQDLNKQLYAGWNPSLSADKKHLAT